MILTAYLKEINLTKKEATSFEEYQYGHTIQQYLGEDINLKEIDIAILSWGNAPYEEIRNQLYQLSSNFRAAKLLDLGQVIEDAFPLMELLDTLIQNQVFPIIISPKDTAIVAQLKAYEQKQELLNLSLVDSKIAFSPYQPNTLINQLLAYHPQLLCYINCIGHQGYLVDKKTIDFLEDKYFDTYRLGTIQQNIEQVEPLVRNADLAAFSINALRCADAPARSFMNPNGLFAAEACQMIRYMTMSDQLSSLCIHGFDLELDTRNQTANMIAQLVWFAVAGFYARMNEYPVDRKNLAAYLVANQEIEEPLTFYKSSKSDRWWVAIPKAVSAKHELIPCSYEDYQTSCGGDLPDRLLNAISRLGL